MAQANHISSIESHKLILMPASMLVMNNNRYAASFNMRAIRESIPKAAGSEESFLIERL